MSAFQDEVRAEWLGHAAARRLLLVLALPAAVGAARVALHSGEASGNGFAPLADGLRAGAVVSSLLALVLGASSVARDRASGALALQHLASPRIRLPLSRAIAILGLVVTGLVLLVGVATGLAAYRFTLGPVVEDGFEMATRAELWSAVVRTTSATLPALFACTAFGLSISSLVSTPGTAVTAALVPLTVFDVFRDAFGGLAELSFVRFVPFLGDGSPLAILPKLARAYSDVVFEPEQLREALVVPSVQGAVMLALAMLVTHQRRPL